MSDPVATLSPPASAEEIFGDGLPLATRFAARLATDGVTRGLIGPRELPRLWERHLLNCAVVADLIPDGARVVDVGTGAGLPGLALVCRRADLRVDLVESLARRVVFLNEVVADLKVGQAVRVVHGRVEDGTVRAAVGNADWVVARAVAPLDRLVRWCLPLLRAGGTLLAMKGSRAESEVAQHEALIHRAGGTEVEILTCGEEALDTPATVVAIRRG